MGKQKQEGKFKVGDKVFYPAHGAGTVQDIRDIDFAGEVQSYYEFKFVNNELTISTPVDNVERLKVRKIHDAKEIEKAIKKLKKQPSIEPSTENYNEIMNLIKNKDISGDINAFIEIIQICNRVKEVRYEDGRLIPSSITKNTKNAISYLVGELSLAKDISYDESEKHFIKLSGLPIE